MSDREQDRKYVILGLRIVGEFGAIIAVPVVLLSLLGKYLDQRYGTAPAFLIAGFLLAAVLSGVSVYRRAREFGREYSQIESKPGQEDGDVGRS
ncbi:MAG: AtpZ/AtpI family protein [bacterium]